MTKTFLAPLFIALLTTACFHKKEQLTILFDRVDGLTEKSPVINKGITIGQIKRLDLFENNVAVDISLNDNIKIPVQSTFTVKNSLIGGSYVSIEYANTNKFLTARDTAYGTYQNQALMDKIMSDTTKRKNIERSLEKIASGIGELIESTKDTIKK